MKLIKKFVICLFLGAQLNSCVDLDIAPQNIIDKDYVYTADGLTSYMASMYAALPMEDFNMSDQGNHNGFFFWNNIKWDMVSTGESCNFAAKDMYVPQKGYWSNGYKIIRQANTLINDLSNNSYELQDVDQWVAEAKFIRAYTYFAMVKRYGGVPIVKEPQEFTGNESELWVARSSHENSIDFILQDLDDAIMGLGEEKIAGRANKYVAAAFKSRVALYAGSVARYGGLFDYTSSEGVKLCGLPSSKAEQYFKQAYSASLIVDEGGYSLYEGDADKALNFRNVFVKADDSPESIFVRRFNINNNVHSYDAVYSPKRMTTTYGGYFSPTLDWVELFDGLPIDPQTGYLKTTDNDGNYIVYENASALFVDAEPRLRGSLLLPDEKFKGLVIDIRSGIIREEVEPSTLIKKFVVDDGFTITPWNTNAWFKENVIVNTQDVFQQKPYINSNGEELKINGLDGPDNGGTKGTLTGFYGAKWLDYNMSIGETALRRSTSTWIDIRYAEVLLNRAEAAVELAQNGIELFEEKNLFQDAMSCINKIRKRAGASLLESVSDLVSSPIVNSRGSGPRSFVFAPNKGLHVIRVERYKELAFEHKIYWDLRRWFTFHEQIQQYRRRMIAPFMFAKGAYIDENTGNPVGQYIYDTRVCERGDNILTFNNRDYYDKIPDIERQRNPLLEQNNQY